MATWSDIEEKAIHDNQKKKLKGTDVANKNNSSKNTSLFLALTEAVGPSRSRLNHIFSKEYMHPVVSLYLNLTGDRTLRDRKIYLTVFNSLVRTGGGVVSGSLDHNARLTLHDDLSEIEYFLNQELVPQFAKSLIIFKSGQGLSEVYLLPVPTKDHLEISRSPYLLPLEVVLKLHPKVLFVYLSKDRARFYSYDLGYEESLDTIKSFTPADSVDASRPGKAQRNRRGLLIGHLKTVADRVTGYKNKFGDLVIVLAGENILLEQFFEYLDTPVKDRVIAKVPLADNHNKDDRSQAVSRCLSEYQIMQENNQLNLIRESQPVRISGLAPVLNAQNQLMVSRLFISENLSAKGYVCPRDNHLSIDQVKCPFCGQSTLPVSNIIDSLVESVISRKVLVSFFRHNPQLLKPYKGVAAFLYKKS